MGECLRAKSRLRRRQIEEGEGGKKQNIADRRLLKNQCGGELQSGGNQEASSAAESSSGYEAVVCE